MKCEQQKNDEQLIPARPVDAEYRPGQEYKGQDEGDPAEALQKIDIQVVDVEVAGSGAVPVLVESVADPANLAAEESRTETVQGSAPVEQPPAEHLVELPHPGNAAVVPVREYEAHGRADRKCGDSDKKERTQPAYETGRKLCHRKGRYEQGCQDEREPSVRLDIEPGIGSHDNRKRDKTDAAPAHRKQQRGPVKEEGSGIQGKQKAQKLPVGFPLHFMADIVWNEAGVAACDYENQQDKSQPCRECKQKPG